MLQRMLKVFRVDQYRIERKLQKYWKNDNEKEIELQCTQTIDYLG